MTTAFIWPKGAETSEPCDGPLGSGRCRKALPGEPVACAGCGLIIFAGGWTKLAVLTVAPDAQVCPLAAPSPWRRAQDMATYQDGVLEAVKPTTKTATDRASASPAASGDDGSQELRGRAASSGVARGPARVLTSLAKADRLGPGDVLVARTMMPAWTVLFAAACAMVTETGGVLSDAAVVAREFGIPAVLNVVGATRLVRDGDLVEVDGTRGTVRIIS